MDYGADRAAPEIAAALTSKLAPKIEIEMADTLESLILDLLDWLMVRDRTYEEVMDAWRTSCPRLPVWEDANDRGLIAREEVNGKSVVKVTPLGRALLGRRKVLSA